MTPKQKQALKEIRKSLLEMQRDLAEADQRREAMYRSLDRMGRIFEQLKQQERAARPFAFLR